ncbi:hypothetical protein [Noviherbaspirillum aerium]|uniref:hypothetical protein n=1 Tax=Noviherbaspirillum aerium TaxID=2588497 RepID=UPI00124F40AB|nr:hypothetical protein [Noviherbaspirillum aerium]
MTLGLSNILKRSPHNDYLPKTLWAFALSIAQRSGTCRFLRGNIIDVIPAYGGSNQPGRPEVALNAGMPCFASN